MTHRTLSEIDEAQEKTHYAINGQRFLRIRYGSESDDWGADSGPCVPH